MHAHSLFQIMNHYRLGLCGLDTEEVSSSPTTPAIRLCWWWGYWGGDSMLSIPCGCCCCTPPSLPPPISDDEAGDDVLTPPAIMVIGDGERVAWCVEYECKMAVWWWGATTAAAEDVALAGSRSLGCWVSRWRRRSTLRWNRFSHRPQEKGL